MIGLFVFGGTDPETGCEYKNVSEVFFQKRIFFNQRGRWELILKQGLTWRIQMFDTKLS